MKVGFVSLGCAKNLIDSENMMAMLVLRKKPKPLL